MIRGVSLPRPENNRTPKDIELPFETRSFSGAFGLTIEGWLIPSSASKGLVILFHGNGTSKSSLLPAAKVIHQDGWDCFLLDFHGSGGSAGTTTSIGWFEATDVAEAYNRVRVAYRNKPVVLYGASMGSAAILRAIAENGIQPDGIILEQPFDTLLNTVRQRYKAMGLPATPFAELLVLYGGLNRGFNGFDHNPATYAREVTCRALVLNGELDDRATPVQAENVFRNLGGKKTKKQFARLGHVSFAEARPGVWRAVVNDFLTTVFDSFPALPAPSK